MEEVMMEKLDELLSRVRAYCLKPELPCMLMPELGIYDLSDLLRVFVGCISDFHGVASDHRDKSNSLFDFMYGVSHTDHSVKTYDSLKTVSVSRDRILRQCKQCMGPGELLRAQPQKSFHRRCSITIWPRII